MKESMTKKSMKNASFGFGSQLCIVLLNFISRSIFIKILGEEYLGLNGLFSNILNVLSLTDLGFSGAIIFCLYKPLVKHDNEKVSRLMWYYKKLYIMFSLIILTIGVALIPFLKYLVNLPTNIPYIKLYYFLFLLNVVASYLYAYKNAILEADQKSYYLKTYMVISIGVQFILQLIVLLLYKNYLLFLIVQLFCTIFNNLLGARKVNKLYPFLKNKNDKITKSEKKEVYKNVSGVFISKLSNVILLNTDNIIISIIVGTIIVGYYSNYYLIINSVFQFVNIIFVSLYGTIGQYNVGSNPKEKYNLFKTLCMCSFIITGVCSICFLVLFQDFIVLWVGDSFLLSNNVMYVIVANFYFNTIVSPINLFRDTTGLFNDTKYMYILTCVLNIILSVVFGKFFGIFGILAATIVAKVLTSLWFDPYIIHKKIFEVNVFKYYLSQIVQLIIVIIVFICMNYLMSLINYNNSIFTFIIKGLIVFIVSSIIFICICINTKPFKYLIEKLRIFKKERNKKKLYNS